MRDSHAHGKKGDVVHWLDGRDTRSVGNGRYGSEHQRPHVQPVQPGRDGREANWGRRVRWRPRRAKGIAFITVDGMGGRASLWITYTILNTWVMVRSKTVRQGSLSRERPPKGGRGKVAEPLATFPPARGAPAPKNTGSLSPLPPPPVRRYDAPCEARTPWRGTTRRVTVADWGNPGQPLSNADSRAQPGPQRRGLCPLRV